MTRKSYIERLDSTSAKIFPGFKKGGRLKNRRPRKRGSIAGFSHNVRTSMAIIKESIELLLDEIPGNLNKDQKRILNICRSSIKRLVDEVNKVL